MYRLTTTDAVQRIADGAVVPAGVGNADWRAYQAWLAEGNSPQPAPSQPLDQPAAVIRAKDKRKLVIDALTAIAGRLQRAGDTTNAVACDALAVQLLAINLKAIAAIAADDEAFDAQVMAAYRALAAGAPAVVAAAFGELS